MNTLTQRLGARVDAATGSAFDILTLTGQLADGDTITIAGTVYEADDDATITAGNVSVDITGNASAADDVNDLVTAILANQGDDLRAIDLGDEVAVISRKGSDLVLAETATNATWLNAGAAGAGYPGTDPAEDANIPAILSRAAIASEVTLGTMPFVFGKTPTAVIAQVRTAAGAVKAWDGVIAIDEELVTLDNAGAVDWAATDVVTILATF